MEYALTGDYWGDPDGIESESPDVVQLVLHPLPRPAAVIAQVCASVSAAIRPRESIGKNLATQLVRVAAKTPRHLVFRNQGDKKKERGKRKKSLLQRGGMANGEYFEENLQNR